MRSSTAELVRSPEALIAPRMQVRPSPGGQSHQGSRVLPAATSFSARCQCPRGICVRHDADPVINVRQIARKCSVSAAFCRPVSWMRALAAVSSSLSVAISAAAYAVRSSLVKRLGKRPSINQRPHGYLFAPWRRQSRAPAPREDIWPRGCGPFASVAYF